MLEALLIQGLMSWNCNIQCLLKNRTFLARAGVKNSLYSRHIHADWETHE